MTSDPPPQNVVVHETAQASWSWGDNPQGRGLPLSSATHSDSIGGIDNNIPTTYDNQHGGQHGQRTTVKSGTSGSVVVSCSLDATVTVTATTQAAKCDASVSYDASITSIEILRKDSSGAYKPIIGENAKCLPGESIDLSVSGAEVSSTYSWSITGDYFKNFTPSTPSVYEGTGAVALNQATCVYRYIKGYNANKNVSCSVTVLGTSVNVENKLYVGKPEPNWRAKEGLVQIVPGNTIKLWANAATGAARGIDWDTTEVTLPTGFGGGQFAFFQLATPMRFHTETAALDGSSIKYKWDINGREGLDTSQPYGSVIATIPNPIDTGDSPSQPKDDSSWTEIKINNETFQVWLMFRKNASESWVPLQKGTWSWSGTYKLNPTTNIWELSGQQGPNFSKMDTDAFPQWSYLNVATSANWVVDTTP